MRKPGDFVLGMADALCTRRFRETLVLPALADMQHEWGEAGDDPKQRARVRLRGYLGLLAGAALYALLMPARHVREIWWGNAAPGPALVRAAAGATLAYTGILLVPHFVVATVRSGWLFLPNTVGPGVFIWFPAALAIGVGRTITRARSDEEKRAWTRAALAIGPLGSALCLLWALQMVGPYRRLLHSPGPPSHYTNEDVARIAANAQGRPQVAPMPVRGRTPLPSHRWMVRPALCVSLVVLAAVLAWSTHPRVLPLVVVVAFLFSHTLSPQPGPDWHFHAAPLSLAAVVGLFSWHQKRRRPSTA